MPKHKVWYSPLQNKLDIKAKRNSLFFLCQATSSCRVLNPAALRDRCSTGTRLSLENQLHVIDGFTPSRVSQSWASCDTKAALTVWQNEPDNTGADHWAPREPPHQRKAPWEQGWSVSTELSPTESHPPNPSKQFLLVDQRNRKSKANKSLFLPFRKSFSKLLGLTFARRCKYPSLQ